MCTTVLRLSVRRRRDVVQARQQARQVARLLGFGPFDQACIAAAVFEIACHLLERPRRGELKFQIRGQSLEIAAAASEPEGDVLPGAALRLEKCLPDHALGVDRTDLAWVIQEVARVAPTDVFAEMRRQNQEMLQALYDLHASRTGLKRERPAA
jgi:hypothetical protein